MTTHTFYGCVPIVTLFFFWTDLSNTLMRCCWDTQAYFSALKKGISGKQKQAQVHTCGLLNCNLQQKCNKIQILHPAVYTPWKQKSMNPLHGNHMELSCRTFNQDPEASIHYVTPVSASLHWLQHTFEYLVSRVRDLF